MFKKLILVSGPIASGKSELARRLESNHGAHCFRTKDWILRRAPDTPENRVAMQKAGAKLDERDNGRWVLDSLVKELHSGDGIERGPILVIDSVRIAGQVEALRAAYGSRVVHIHVTASADVLRRRYEERRRKRPGEPHYDIVRKHPTEKQVGTLAESADAVINSDRCTIDDIETRACSFLELHPSAAEGLVDVVVGGQYGSEGKGNIVSYIAPEYDYLVRVGGPNAGHKVYMEPKPYTFHLLPSGTRHSQAKLIIGAGAVLRADVLMQEIQECGVETGRLIVDEQAMIVTKKDIAAERTLVDRIGSTGQGAGAATARKIMERDTKKLTLAKNFGPLKGYVGSAQREFDRAYRDGKRILLEGTQGTSLSIHHGVYPWVTSRDTAASGCLSEAGISPRRVRKVIMVCRTYPIRVGNATKGKSGPMSQEINLKTISSRSGIPILELRKTERTSTTNRPRRIGEFDWELLRRNSQLNAPTDIALTFVDYLHVQNRRARRYEQLQLDTLRFIEEVERVASAPVSLISTRFHSRSVIDRRIW